jgi:hypothetical protein
MTAEELKAEALAWLRYTKRCQVVCTEVGIANGNYLADVVGASTTAVYEVEVKISRSDFKNDKLSKSEKFHRYAHAKPGFTHRVPNYFYYFIPEGIKEYVTNLMAEEDATFEEAGLIVYRPDYNYRPGANLESIKPARKLHSEKPSRRYLYEILMRTSSELCGTKVALARLQNELSTMVARVDAQVIQSARRVGGTLDIEDPTADIDYRARQLAEAVDSIPWAVADEATKQKWISAARRLMASEESEYWQEAFKE